MVPNLFILPQLYQKGLSTHTLCPFDRRDSMKELFFDFFTAGQSQWLRWIPDTCKSIQDIVILQLVFKLFPFFQYIWLFLCLYPLEWLKLDISTINLLLFIAFSIVKHQPYINL